MAPLRPCPFCGSSVRLEPSSGTPRLMQFVCESPVSTCRGSGLFQCCWIEDVPSTITAWNRRAVIDGELRELGL